MSAYEMCKVLEMQHAKNPDELLAVVHRIQNDERDRILDNLRRAGYHNALSVAVPERYVSKEEIRCVDRDGYIDHDPWGCDGTECRFADQRAEQDNPEEP